MFNLNQQCPKCGMVFTNFIPTSLWVRSGSFFSGSSLRQPYIKCPHCAQFCTYKFYLKNAILAMPLIILLIIIEGYILFRITLPAIIESVYFYFQLAPLSIKLLAGALCFSVFGGLCGVIFGLTLGLGLPRCHRLVAAGEITPSQLIKYRNNWLVVFLVCFFASFLVRWRIDKPRGWDEMILLVFGSIILSLIPVITCVYYTYREKHNKWPFNK